MASISRAKPVIIREVWQENLTQEFSLIQALVKEYPYASFDTEFPGVIFYSSKYNKTPSENYEIMKKNVNALHLIQLGLTLSDSEGNLPSCNNFSYVWQFNFREFDVARDLQNPDSVNLLKSQGIDFLKHNLYGIDSVEFANQFLKSDCFKICTWITFHSIYDFGYLIKVLSKSNLPDDLNSYMELIIKNFGPSVYDMKEMIKICGLYGGLERVAKSLNVDRVAGKSHQAGSDSLLTMQAFLQLKKYYFSDNLLSGFNYKLYGLEGVH